MRRRRKLGEWSATSLATAVLLAATGVPAAPAESPATYDTLGVRSVLEGRQSVLDSLLLPESTQFDTAGTTSLADSLDRGGAAAIAAQKRAVAKSHKHHIDLGFQPLALTTYNRVEGMRVGIGIQPSLTRWLRLDLAGAYGFSSKRWSGRTALELGKRRGPLLRFEWQDLSRPFGPQSNGRSLGFWSLVAGQDRRDYLRRRGFGLDLWAYRRGRTRLGVRTLATRETSLDALTDFHFFGGGTAIELPNPPVDDGDLRSIALMGHDGDLRSRTWLDGEVGWAGGPAGGDFDYNWQRVAGGVRPYIPGGRLSIGFETTHVGGSPPLQSAAYLGGDANLRAYDRLEFAGRQTANVRLEYSIGLDLLARTRIPVIERFKLQFIPFLDAGSTWDDVHAAAQTSGSLEGDPRSSVGLGLQRLLWLPGLEAVRVDIMVRTDRSDDRWGFWVRSLALDEVFEGDD